MYIVAQIIGFIAFVISLIAYHRNKKEKILGNMIISNILNLIHYLLLEAYSGCATKVMAIARDSFIIIKKKNKVLSSNIFLILFILIYIVVGIFTYNGILSIFPIVAATIYIIPISPSLMLTARFSVMRTTVSFINLLHQSTDTWPTRIMVLHCLKTSRFR